MATASLGRIIDEYELLRPLYRDPTTNQTSSEDILNVTFGGVSVVVFLMLLVPAVVAYYGKKSWRLFHILFCWSTWRHRSVRVGEISKQSWKERVRRQRWIYLLLNFLLIFLVIRIIHETLALIRDSLYLQGSNPQAEDVFTYLRRTFDAISMGAFFSLYSLIIPIWLQSALIWLSVNRFARRRILASAVVYIFVALLNIMTVITFLPFALSGLLPLFGVGKSDMNGYDASRRMLIFAYVLPLEIVQLLIITLFVFVFGIIIIRMIRGSMYLQVKGSRQVQDQIQTIVKLSIGMLIFTIGVLTRIVGFAIYSIPDLPSWATQLVVRLLPDASFVFCTLLIFWPYRLPLLPQVIAAPLHMRDKWRENTGSFIHRLRHRRSKINDDSSTATDLSTSASMSSVRHVVFPQDPASAMLAKLLLGDTAAADTKNASLLLQDSAAEEGTPRGSLDSIASDSSTSSAASTQGLLAPEEGEEEMDQYAAVQSYARLEDGRDKPAGILTQLE